MPLWRGADDAATAGQRQGEDRNQSCESCHCCVDHLVDQRIFAEAHNLCGQGGRHLVERLQRHYVVGQKKARSSHSLWSFLRRMRMAVVSARGPGHPFGAIRPQSRSLPVQHGILVRTVVHVLPGQPLDDVPRFQEPRLKVFNDPKLWAPEIYDVQAALHDGVRAVQVPRRLGASSRFRILGAWRRAPDDVRWLEAERREFPV